MNARSIARLCSGILLLRCSLLSAFGGENGTLTHTNIQFSPEGLSLTITFPLETLAAAGLHAPDGSGQQFYQAGQEAFRLSLLQFIEQHVAVSANDRHLQADSTSFLFCFAATEAGLKQVEVMQWYALLQRPETIQVSNSMLAGAENPHRNLGALQTSSQILEFEFAQSSNEAPAAVHFEVIGKDKIQLSNGEPVFSQAATAWLSAGIGGLIILSLATRIRNRIREQVRRQEQVMRPLQTGSHARKAPSQAAQLETIA